MEIENNNRYISNDLKEIYHFGVIDYLQTWDNHKKMEYYFKTIFKR